MGLRNYLPRRIHSERSQPAHRRQLGVLEKKTDYRQRARNYNKNKKEISTLAQKAMLANPEEFNFEMLSGKITKRGFHISKQAKVFTAQQIQMMKAQDLKYLELRLSQERAKYIKMRDRIQFLSDVSSSEIERSINRDEALRRFEQGEFTYDPVEGEEDDDLWGFDEEEKEVSQPSVRIGRMEQKLKKQKLKMEALEEMCDEQRQQNKLIKGGRVKKVEDDEGNVQYIHHKKRKR
ncbi:hypothetical protein PCE1_003752 [Barthelona sp. PCE]